MGRAQSVVANKNVKKIIKRILYLPSTPRIYKIRLMENNLHYMTIIYNTLEVIMKAKSPM